VRVDAEGVAHDQADGAGHGGVRPEAGAERAARGVEAEVVPYRAVDHDHRGGSAGGLPAAAAGGALAHQRVEGGQHHREVLGQAAGHGGVDGGQVHRAVPADLLEGADDVVGVLAGGGQERLDQGLVGLVQVQLGDLPRLAALAEHRRAGLHGRSLCCGSLCRGLGSAG
jgi:hypothetical protein